MPDTNQEWASTDEHAPKVAASGEWASTDDHAPKAQPKSFGEHLSNAASEIWKNVNPVNWVTGLNEIVKDPLTAVKNYGAQNEHIANRAEEAFKKGDYAAGTAHVANYLLNMVPGLGQGSEESADEAAKGNWGTAVGKAVGPPLGIVAGAKLPGAVNAVAGKAGPFAKSVTTEVLGKTTGVGANTIRTALENPTPELKAAMRGSTDAMDVVDHFKDALQNVKDARSAEYQAKLAQIPAGSPLDITPVQDAFNTALKKHNVKVITDPKTEATHLDFSRSTISDSAAQNVVKSVHDDLSSWGSDPADLTPRGVDILKRRIDDLYAPSSNARALVQSVKSTTRDVLNNQVPGYQEMTKGYATASEFLDQLKDLSLENKNPGTAVRKITTLLNQNNTYRQALTQQLAQYTPTDLQGEVAGLQLNKMAPRGIMGPASGGGLLFLVATHALQPQAALAMAMASPRLMGELMAAMNKIKPTGAIPGTAASALGTAVRSTGVAGSIANQQSQ